MNLRSSLSTLVLLLLLVILAITGCDGGSSSSAPAPPPPPPPADSLRTGLIWDQGSWGSVETDLPNAGMLGLGRGVEKQVDLTAFFPPIGDQGPYGTCVAWAIGYNLKSFLEARDRNWAPDTTDTQFSPKFLYWMIDENLKVGCDGTQFEFGMDVMLNYGIATLETVPYEDLGPSCDIEISKIPASWLSEARQFMIQDYRRIDNITIDTIKAYLSQDRPVVFGAELGPAFMRWNSDAVLVQDTKGINGMHARHAMIVAGYDDNKGPNGAFLVVNSWGESWGNNGTIWIDYNHFLDFTLMAFVATNSRSQDYDPEKPVNPPELADLLAWQVYIWSQYQSYLFGYNVFNVGQRTVSYNENWSVVLLFMNAYDLNDWGILAMDSFSDSYGHAQPLVDYNGTNWHLDFITGEGMYRDYWNAIPFRISSQLRGYYYFVLFVDPFDSVREYDESNNILFWNYLPIFVSAGMLSMGLTSESPLHPNANSKERMSLTPSTLNPNAYREDEVRKLIEFYKASGMLDDKISEFRLMQPDNENNSSVHAPLIMTHDLNPD